MRRTAGIAAVTALFVFSALACGRSNVGSSAPKSTMRRRSPTAAAPTPLPDRGVISLGTYATQLQPEMTFTAVSAGWEVDVDTHGWVGMEFPLPDHILGTLSIIRIDKVFDPERPRRLIDPPKDLAGFIAGLPGVKVVAPPIPVTVGAIEAMQLDIIVGRKNVQLGPIPGALNVEDGFGKGQAFRIIELTVKGQYVQISFAPDEAGSKHFDSAVDLAQPLIDSIIWS